MHIFFFNDTATTEIYTLSLHDALPIYIKVDADTRDRFAAAGFEPFTYTRKDGTADSMSYWRVPPGEAEDPDTVAAWADRKSTRLNSSHANISYAVFCLKKKKSYKIDDS